MNPVTLGSLTRDILNEVEDKFAQQEKTAEQAIPKFEAVTDLGKTIVKIAGDLKKLASAEVKVTNEDLAKFMAEQTSRA